MTCHGKKAFIVNNKHDLWHKKFPDKKKQDMQFVCQKTGKLIKTS